MAAGRQVRAETARTRPHPEPVSGTGRARPPAPRLQPRTAPAHTPGKANEVAMRASVLKTWTPAWLLLTALLAGATTAETPKVDADEGRPPLCAAPTSPLSMRQVDLGHAGSTRGTAITLALLAGGGRLPGLPH